MKKKNVWYALLFVMVASMTSCVVTPRRGYAYGPPPPRYHRHHHYNGW